jgi:hypothetical protein
LGLGPCAAPLARVVLTRIHDGRYKRASLPTHASAQARILSLSLCLSLPLTYAQMLDDEAQVVCKRGREGHRGLERWRTGRAAIVHDDHVHAFAVGSHHDVFDVVRLAAPRQACAQSALMGIEILEQTGKTQTTQSTTHPRTHTYMPPPPLPHTHTVEHDEDGARVVDFGFGVEVLQPVERELATVRCVRVSTTNCDKSLHFCLQPAFSFAEGVSGSVVLQSLRTPNTSTQTYTSSVA